MEIKTGNGNYRAKATCEEIEVFGQCNNSIVYRFERWMHYDVCDVDCFFDFFEPIISEETVSVELTREEVVDALDNIRIIERQSLLTKEDESTRAKLEEALEKFKD